MSDTLDKEYPQQSVETPDEPVVTETPDESAVVEAPAEPVMTDATETAVPPATFVAPEPPVVVAGVRSGYDDAVSYDAPISPSHRMPSQEYYYSPTVEPTPVKGNSRGWLVLVAILAALAVLISGMSVAFIWLDRETRKNDKAEETSQTDKGDKKPNKNDSQVVLPNENAPSIEQKPGNQPDDIDPEKDYYYGDGGLSTETIVSRNYHSTVVLTMYAETSYHYFGESSLQEVGAASGIVWTEDGYVITNCHCVINDSTGEKYDRIDVTMYDGTVYEADVVGADEATDLAVIKLKDKDTGEAVSGLTPAEFGDSDELAIGSRVVALGNAFGLSWTATQGIVSAKARDVYEDTGYAIKCLQVDAAINSGNSGGPLLNKYGQVVGINSAKIAASGVEGLGFSIPINEAKVVLESLAQYGYVKGRVALGITGNTIDNGFYHGFMIVDILDGSCLEDTDAQEQDLIVAVDGVKVVDYGTLRAELAKHQVGDTVTLTLLRSERRTGEVTSFEVEVTLKEQTAN